MYFWPDVQKTRILTPDHFRKAVAFPDYWMNNGQDVFTLLVRVLGAHYETNLNYESGNSRYSAQKLKH